MSMLARAPVQAPAHLTPPPHFAAISVSAAAVAITFALLLRWKKLARLEFLKPWLYLIAGIGFAAAFATGWANTIAGWSRQFPYVGSAIPVVIACVLAYIVLYDFYPRHASNQVTEISALLLPAWAPAMPGSAGSMLATAISWIAVTAGSAIGKAFGV